MTGIRRALPVALLAPLVCLAAPGSAAALSCVAVSEAQMVAPADVVAVGRFLDGPAVGHSLISPARMEVEEYLKGTGPDEVEVTTATTKPDRDGTFSAIGGGFDPRAGERYRLIAYRDKSGRLSPSCGGELKLENDVAATPLKPETRARIAAPTVGYRVAKNISGMQLPVLLAQEVTDGKPYMRGPYPEIATGVVTGPRSFTASIQTRPVRPVKGTATVYCVKDGFVHQNEYPLDWDWRGSMAIHITRMRPSIKPAAECSASARAEYEDGHQKGTISLSLAADLPGPHKGPR